MLIKKAKHLPFQLSENSQSNSLRWSLLYKEEDGTFTDQTGLFKCKDYFNDIVAKYHGVDLFVYGFNTAPITLNDEGTWVLLSQLTNQDNLYHHLPLISEQAEGMGFAPLTFSKEGKNILLFIPSDYYSSTYIISLLTGFIRIGHSAQKFDTFEEMCEKYPEKSVDLPFKYEDKAILSAGFAAPYHTWTYLGKTRKMPTKAGYDASPIHNAGCVNTIQLMRAGV